jgi:hypothetical protein
LEDENEEINKHNLDRSFNLQLAKRGNDGAYFLLGLTVTVFVIVARFTSFVIPLPRQWALLVVRVAGSWIAASGLLMLGWALRGPRTETVLIELNAAVHLPSE